MNALDANVGGPDDNAAQARHLIPVVSTALKSRDYKGPSSDGDGDGDGDGAPLIPCVTHCLRGNSFDAGEDGAGRGTPIIPILEDRVRRLTPRECERLMGFPDDFTLIQYRGKPASDSPRYRSIGNSIAVNCAKWILSRIDMVETMLAGKGGGE